MAEYFDKKFEELVEGSPKVVRNGLTGTQMIVYADPAGSDGKVTKGVIVEYNSTGKVMGTWPIREGRAYRGTPNRIKSMPFIEADTNIPRRYCREYGVPLHSIFFVKRDEERFPGGAGRRGEGVIKTGEEPVKWVRLYTGPNERNNKLFIVADEMPAKYEEFIAMAERSR